MLLKLYVKKIHILRLLKLFRILKHIFYTTSGYNIKFLDLGNLPVIDSRLIFS